ncbi:MAG: hypothetical protein Q9221_002140 [Calogaya cf. arnoldii]
MERPNSGLRRRSVQSDKKLPEPPIPIVTASVEEIDPLDPAPPLTPRRRRSTNVQRIEPTTESGVIRWFGRQLRCIFDAIEWIFKIIAMAIFTIFMIALFNALPLEVRTKTARNFYEIATGWRTVFSPEGWLVKAVVEWFTGMLLFERKLVECWRGKEEFC